MKNLEHAIAPRALEAVHRMHRIGEERELSDDELVLRLERVADRARQRMVETIRYLAEVERRGVHLKKGMASLYKFCLVALRMSEDQAYRHINAVRLAQMYPLILPMLERGELHLSALALVKKHLKTAEDEWLIHVVAGKSKRQMQKILATYFPRAVPGPVHRIELLNEEKARLEVVLDVATIEKLEDAAAMMAHQHPSQTLDVVIDGAVDLLVAKLRARRFGESSRPQKNPRASSIEHVSRASRRETFAKAEHQCTFVSDDGLRCDGQAFLEIDHVTPRAKGGASDTANLRILCRAHNAYSARAIFGEEAVRLVRSRHEHEWRETEQREKEQREKEQREKREKEQREKREKEQREKEQHEKEQHEKEQREKEQREKEQREKREKEHEKEQRETDQHAKEATRKEAATKLEFALKSMGFRVAVAKEAVGRFIERHPDDDFSELGIVLGEILRSVPSG